MIRKKLDTLTEEQKKLTEYMYNRAMRYRNPKIIHAISIKKINHILGIAANDAEKYSKIKIILAEISKPVNISNDENRIYLVCFFDQLIINYNRNIILYSITPEYTRG